jgi:hypothetical protein
MPGQLTNVLSKNCPRVSSLTVEYPCPYDINGYFEGYISSNSWFSSLSYRTKCCLGFFATLKELKHLNMYPWVSLNEYGDIVMVLLASPQLEILSLFLARTQRK